MRTTAEKALAIVMADRPPFDSIWARWRLDVLWETPELPVGWETV